MNNQIAKSGNNHPVKSLDEEWRLMNAALAKLGPPAKPPTGRLVVILDLTGSRAESLKQAQKATAAMFETIKVVGAVAVKLVYYRGDDECRASQWHGDAHVLSEAMLRLFCKTGVTQIARTLRLVLAEKEKICGVVFVGDHCEDDPEELLGLAQTLGRRSVPLFVFHECADHDSRALEARPIFERMAKLSGGVYSEFRPDSGVILRELLSTVAAFSAAGKEGLKQVAAAGTPEGRQLQARLLLGPAEQK